VTAYRDYNIILVVERILYLTTVTVLDCNCNWGTCSAPPNRRPRAHNRVNPYLGAW